MRKRENSGKYSPAVNLTLRLCRRAVKLKSTQKFANEAFYEVFSVLYKEINDQS